MKVIIIKDCKDGTKNEVIDVSAGYATNFLIKQNLAVPLNNQTKKALNKRLKSISENNEHNLDNAKKVKNILENTTLFFTLGVTENKIHGSITRKQIIKELRNKNINLDPRTIDNDKIESIGISKVKVHLHKDLVAELRIEVRENDK